MKHPSSTHRLLINSRLILIITGLLWCTDLWAQTGDSNELARPDSAAFEINIADSIQADSSDTAALSEKPKRISSLESTVEYQSDDSMRVDLTTRKVYLYGNAIAVYGDIELKADYIEISLKTSELYATGLPDSTGVMQGEPVFTQGDQMFEAGEMRYNFKSKRGLSKHVKTQEGGGYLHGETVKRDTGEIIYIKNGKFTTCEYDDPHFHIHAGKLKVIPKDKIITGPAYLSIAGVPTPLVLPFGFFPNTEKQANGLILPTWGDYRDQGFALQNGGYYFGVKDYMDFAITADVYTRGGWAGYLASNYAKRYRFRGNYKFSYVNNVFNERDYPDYYRASTFNVNWNHSQDAKARPGTNFSATVDAGSSKSYRNNYSSTTNDFLKSQMNSNIIYSKIFANSPFTFKLAANGTQNTQNKFVSIKAPQSTLTMSRIFPFKPKKPLPSNSFISRTGITDIGINGDADFTNRLEGVEDTLFNNYDNRMFKNMQNGVRLKASIGTSLKLFKYITVNPTTDHKFIGYRKTYRQRWNEDSARVEEYFVNGLDGYYDGGASLRVGTTFYGTYLFKNEVIKAMRHQVIPNVSLNYKPDYSKPAWGYFDEIVIDTTGRTRLYSYFDQGIYSDRPAAQENGVLNFSVKNTLEMKVRNQNDSTGDGKDQKLKIFDGFNFSSAYNLAKDSLNWSPLNVEFWTQVVPGLQVNANAALDPYHYSPTGIRTNEFEFDRSGALGTWTNARVQFSYNIKPKNKNENNKSDTTSNSLSGDRYFSDFIDYSLPWNMNINYNITYTDNGKNHTLTQVIDLRGQLEITRNWQIGYRTGFDIIKQELTYTTFEIYRDLHCWEFSLGVVPFGNRQSYNFQINVKSQVLSDLKIPRRKNYSVPDRS